MISFRVFILYTMFVAPILLGMQRGTTVQSDTSFYNDQSSNPFEVPNITLEPLKSKLDMIVNNIADEYNDAYENFKNNIGGLQWNGIPNKQRHFKNIRGILDTLKTLAASSNNTQIITNMNEIYAAGMYIIRIIDNIDANLGKCFAFFSDDNQRNNYKNLAKQTVQQLPEINKQISSILLESKVIQAQLRTDDAKIKDVLMFIYAGDSLNEIAKTVNKVMQKIIKDVDAITIAKPSTSTWSKFKQKVKDVFNP